MVVIIRMRNYIYVSAVCTFLIGCGEGVDSDIGERNGAVGAPAAAYSADVDVRYQVNILASTVNFGLFEPSTSLNIEFNEYSELASPQELLINDIIEPGCEVNRGTFEEFDLELENTILPTQDYQLVSAGEILTITSPAGTWAELAQDSDPFWAGLYDTDSTDSVLGVLPENATLDIPGDIFPATSSVALLAPEQLTGVQFSENGQAVPVFGSVTPNTTIQWDPATGTTNSLVNVSFVTYDDTGVSFSSCFVEDSGEYEFPASVRQSMDDSYDVYTITRIQQYTEQRDDVLISQFATSTFIGM